MTGLPDTAIGAWPDADAAVSSITTTVLERLTRTETLTPAPLLLLLRRYLATGRDELRAALEPSLAGAIEAWPRSASDQWPAWLVLFGESAALSDDERLRQAATELAAKVAGGWPTAATVQAVASGIDAYLASTDAIGEAIDELERVVAAWYQPGEGIAPRRSRSAASAASGPRLVDQVATASALLTAYTRTGRLPYSMLAEELMQFSRRLWWDDDRVRFRQPLDGDADERATFSVNCAAVSVLCRLASLHADEEYRASAVVAAGADYARDAAHILNGLASDVTLSESAPAGRHDGAGEALDAELGLALDEWIRTKGSS